MGRFEEPKCRRYWSLTDWTEQLSFQWASSPGLERSWVGHKQAYLFVVGVRFFSSHWRWTVHGRCLRKLYRIPNHGRAKQRGKSVTLRCLRSLPKLLLLLLVRLQRPDSSMRFGCSCVHFVCWHQLKLAPPLRNKKRGSSLNGSVRRRDFSSCSGFSPLQFTSVNLINNNEHESSYLFSKRVETPNAMSIIHCSRVMRCFRKSFSAAPNHSALRDGARLQEGKSQPGRSSSLRVLHTDRMQ